MGGGGWSPSQSLNLSWPREVLATGRLSPASGAPDGQHSDTCCTVLYPWDTGLSSVTPSSKFRTMADPILQLEPPWTGGGGHKRSFLMAPLPRPPLSPLGVIYDPITAEASEGLQDGLPAAS
jgi:hypothetical protein